VISVFSEEDCIKHRNPTQKAILAADEHLFITNFVFVFLCFFVTDVRAAFTAFFSMHTLDCASAKGDYVVVHPSVSLMIHD